MQAVTSIPRDKADLVPQRVYITVVIGLPTGLLPPLPDKVPSWEEAGWWGETPLTSGGRHQQCQRALHSIASITDAGR